VDWAIEISQLTKSYKGNFWEPPVAVLKGLSLKVPFGSVYGFLGANGAGKTTTIKIILDLQRADSGSIRLLGGNPGDASVRSRIGFLPERPYFPDWMKAGEFLDLARGLFSATANTRIKGNEELLELVGLKNIAGRPLRSFSKGMLQRIGIAQVLVGDPDLVILDEPMSGLDPEGRRDTRDLISRLHELGKTVFFSSHILSDVEQICDEFIFLQNGAVKTSGSVAEVLAQAGTSYEMTFRGIQFPVDKLAGVLQRNLRSGGILLRQVPPEKAQELISFSLSHGGELISMHSSQGTLEQMLFPEKKVWGE
jgi:ABC-2 type transport system ATP-binding protein